MLLTTLADYVNLTVKYQADAWCVYQGSDRQGNSLRITVFSEDVSADDAFRAAWRRDTELLKRLRHDCLPRIVSAADEEGIVFVATESVNGLPVSEYLQTVTLNWDETADLGWQAASFIQQLHNCGVTHGGLSENTMLINDQLRVTVVDSGCARWVLASTDGAAAANFADSSQRDLVALGGLLEQLANAHQSDGRTSDSPVPQEWWDLIKALSDPAAPEFPSTAREVQGRLGAILLGDAGDAMDVIADRSGPGQSRRSIVDELLDEPFEPQSEQRTGSSTDKPRFEPVSFVVIAVAAAICAAIIAWLVN